MLDISSQTKDYFHSMTTIAFDPGLSTGVAIHTSNRVVISSEEGSADIPGEYFCLVITEPKKLWDLILVHSPDVVCVENFASGGLISKDGQATLRLIGAIELACYIREIRLIIQFPQERYPFMDVARDMLKQIKKTPISHEVDALSHLLLYEHRRDTGVLEKIVARRRQTW